MKYYVDDELCCIVHKAKDWNHGLDFITPDEEFIQVGTWWYEAGKELDRHYHNRVSREANLTQETVIVLQGSLEVALYDLKNILTKTFELKEGDFAVFLRGGHGYTVREDNTRIIEVKNGPFLGVNIDKTRF